MITSELFDGSSEMDENQIQDFESNANEVFNFSTGMEMIGFGKASDGWKKSSSQLSAGPSTYNHYFSTEFPESTSGNLMVGAQSSGSSSKAAGAWHESRFLDETNHFSRSTQALSLSLSSNLGLQGHVTHHSQDQQHVQDMRFVTLNSRASGFPYEQHVDGFSGKSTSFHQEEFQLRNSQYLGPAQELLNEFCSLGSEQNGISTKQKGKKHLDQVQEQQSLHSLDFMELHRRKLKLLSMLEEVDRRYKHYQDQMKTVVSAFEAVAGSRSADVYSSLALKAMSRHFRCLRDAIVNEIEETKKAMGDKDQTVAGTSRGETPRLRALDQSLRRQKALQQMGMMESHPWRPQRGLPERSVSVLRAWLFEHFLHPYPTDVDKHILARQTGLSRSQVSNWFINARVRLWKPMVEDMYQEELREQEENSASSERAPEDMVGQPSQIHHEDQKPTHEQLARMDSACLPSNIMQQRTEDHENSRSTFQNQHNNMQHYGRLGENFGAIDLDFSSYNDHSSGVNHNFSGPAGVSLTLGLQQHGGSLAFSPTAPENSLFYSRDPMEDCQPVQYSLIDGETHNLPYRDLMGAQFLHDLAG